MGDLKWLFVQIGPYPGSEGEGYDFDTITERLGYRYDIDFASCHGIASEKPSGKLRCYSDDFFGTYSTGESTACDYYTRINSNYPDANFIQTYPNPFSSIVSLSILKENIKNVIISVRNIYSQTIFSVRENTTGNFYKKEIDLGNEANWIYLLYVNIDGITTVKKIVKE